METCNCEMIYCPHHNSSDNVYSRCKNEVTDKSEKMLYVGEICTACAAILRATNLAVGKPRDRYFLAENNRQEVQRKHANRVK